MLVAPLRFKSVLLEEMDRHRRRPHGPSGIHDPEKQLHQRPGDHPQDAAKPAVPVCALI